MILHDQQRSFINVVFGYVLGDVVVKMLQFICVPIYANNCTTAEYGILGTISFFGLILSVILTCSVPAAIFADIKNSIDGGAVRKGLQSFVAVNTIIAIVIFCFAWLVFGLQLYILIFFLSYCINALANVLAIEYQIAEKSWRFRMIGISSGVTTLIAIIYLKEYFSNILLAISVAQFTGSIISLIIGAKFPIIKLAEVYLSFSRYKNLIICMTVYGLVVLFIDQSGRAIVAKYVSRDSAGIYNLCAQCSLALTGVLYSLNTALAPRWFTLSVSDYTKKSRILELQYCFGILVGFCVLTAILIGFNYVFAIQYLPSLNYMPLVFFTSTCWAVLWSTVVNQYVVSNTPKMLATISTVVGVPSLIINIGLSKYFGILGAVISGAFGVLVLISVAVFKHRNCKMIFKNAILKLILLHALMSSVIFIASSYRSFALALSGASMCIFSYIFITKLFTFKNDSS